MSKPKKYDYKPKKYNYQSHDEVPDILWSYMDSIEDVNKFLNFIDESSGLPDEELDIPDPRQMRLKV